MSMKDKKVSRVTGRFLTVWEIGKVELWLNETGEAMSSAGVGEE
jgi:hypothetical protein